MKNKHSADETHITIEHQHFKPKPANIKQLKRLKNILLFGFYIGAVAIIVNFANGRHIQQAFAGNIESTALTEVSDYKTKFDKNALSMEEKLKLHFYAQYMRSQDAACALYYETMQSGVDIYTMLALIKIESNFNPKAVNYNKNGSIDRGLCQLNSFVFKDIPVKDFFLPDVNIHYGVQHFKWCKDQCGENLVKTLAMYNAGYGSVTKVQVGERTLDYIQKILNTTETIKQEEKRYLANYQDLLR